MIDLVIRNTTIIDGTRAPRFTGDIAIRDGRIAAVGRVDEKAKSEINARGTCCRRFMFGSTSVPPATSIASAPCVASRSAASLTLRGA